MNIHTNPRHDRFWDRLYYSIEVTAGQVIHATTSTPAEDPFAFVNTLEPMIELYDPMGTLVDSKTNGALDDRNVDLTHTATETGRYVTRLLGENATRGEYLLRVETEPADSASISLLEEPVTEDRDPDMTELR